MHGARQQDQGLVGDTAARLPWLCPSADALIRLTTEPVPVADLSNDVALVLLSLRYVRSTTNADTFGFSSLRDSVVVEAAAKLLGTHTPHWLPSRNPVAEQLRAFSTQLAAAMGRLAAEGGTVSPEAARAVGLVAPLGWWAVATVSPKAVVDCLSETDSGEDVQAMQRKAWGLSHEDVARRLCSRWRLPTWVSATVGTLSLDVADAVRLGADVELTQLLREALRQVEFNGYVLGRHTQSLKNRVWKPRASANGVAHAEEDPRTLRLLPQLLRTSANARRAGNDHRLRTAEAEVDRLHELLADVRESFEVAVRDAKLSGLAELAAGASHEINNPLAVISGNAQRLRKAEPDEDRRKALDAIVRQSSRISDIVRELMHFARPGTPNRGRVDVGELAAIAVASFQPQASMKGVKLSLEACAEPTNCHGDLTQIRRSLDALIQNAIEATPNGGEIRVVVHADSERTRLIVEDSGLGPSDDAVPHLFDPFYSGRPAGRGRGLGLATAWRLATINGGEVQYHRPPDGPTRFELILPVAETTRSALRITA
jgi:signal transduction histidine kinase